MSLQIAAVPDMKAVLGESHRLQMYQLNPQAADYVSGGYPVNADQFELGKIAGVTIFGTNAAGRLYQMTPVMPDASFGVSPFPATSVKLVVTTGGAEVAAGTDLSGIFWFAEVLGW